MKKNNRTRKKLYCENFDHLNIDWGMYNISSMRKINKLKAEYYLEYEREDGYGHSDGHEIIRVCKYCADNWQQDGDCFVWKFKDDWKIKAEREIMIELDAQYYAQEAEYFEKHIKEWLKENE